MPRQYGNHDWLLFLQSQNEEHEMDMLPPHIQDLLEQFTDKAYKAVTNYVENNPDDILDETDQYLTVPDLTAFAVFCTIQGHGIGYYSGESMSEGLADPSGLCAALRDDKDLSRLCDELANESYFWAVPWIEDTDDDDVPVEGDGLIRYDENTSQIWAEVAGKSGVCGWYAADWNGLRSAKHWLTDLTDRNIWFVSDGVCSLIEGI